MATHAPPISASAAADATKTFRFSMIPTDLRGGLSPRAYKDNRLAPWRFDEKRPLGRRRIPRKAAVERHDGGADLPGVVTERGDLQRGRSLGNHRRQRVDRGAYRVEHEVAGRRNAASQRDGLRIDECDDVGQTNREICGKVLPRRQCMLIARLGRLANFLRTQFVARDVEQRTARKRRCDGKGVTNQSRSRCLRLEAADLSTSADETVRGPNLVVSDFARSPFVAEHQLAAGDDSAADSGAERQQNEIARAASAAEGMFAKRRAARVVADVDRYAEAFAQRLAEGRIRPAEVRTVQHGAGSGIDVPGRSDTDPGDARTCFLERGRNLRSYRIDDRLEGQIVEVLLVLRMNRPVVRDDRRGDVRSAEVYTDSRTHSFYVWRTHRP